MTSFALPPETRQVDLAIFLATSGHSGVDRVFKNLVPALAKRGLSVDLLGIRNHGPDYSEVGDMARRITFDASHVYSAIPHLVKYLKEVLPRVVLSDKDRVNRAVLVSKFLSGASSRIYFRQGTTVSIDLASRKGFDRLLQRYSMKNLYKHSNGVLVPSAGAAKDFLNLSNLDADFIHVVPSPIVKSNMGLLANEEISHPWFLNGELPIILGVGELSSRKNFASLVRAHSLVLDDVQCRLVVLGRGRQRSNLIELTKRLGTTDFVDFPGFVTNPYPYMTKASAFALTSKWEGLPVALIEALALGVPAVATDCPSGPAEILANGRYGPLVPLDDDAALAKSIVEILRHPPSKGKLKEAVSQYTVDNSVHSYMGALGLLG